MKRRQVFRAQAFKTQTSSSARRVTISEPVIPFNPASIAGCQLWFDAADTSSILIDSSSNVSLWIDKSNTGTTATPTRGATANQITYVIVDGYRAIYINNNGSAQYNSSTYSQLTIQSNFQNTADYSIFAVVNLSNVANGPEYQTIYGNARGTSGETRTPNFGAGMTLEFNSDTTNRMINSSFIGSGRLQTALISSSSALTAYTNTTAYASATNGFTKVSTDAGALPIIGGAFGSGNDARFATGYFHEILFYNSVLTPIQRQKVEGYLAWKWGLQSTLPSNHTYKTIAPTYEQPVFAPIFISGNQLWLDGLDPLATGTKPITGTVISTWTDKSGNSRNVSQSTTGSQPTYSNDMLNFNGSQFLTGTNTFDVTNVGTIFAVARHSSTRGRPIDIRMNTTSVGFEVGTTPHMFFHNASGGWIQTFTNGTNNLQVMVVTRNGSSAPQYARNGESLITFTTSQGGASNRGLYFTVGRDPTGTSFMNGVICEIVFYNVYLTTAQRQRVEGYLAQKWGLQSTLPAIHPYKTIAPTAISRSITIQSLSALFNNSSITVPSKSSVTLGINNHTIEFWLYQTSRGQYDCPFQYSTNTSAFSTNSYYMAIGGYIGILIGNDSEGFTINMGSTVSLPSLNAWHHYAIVRNGTTFTLYIDGISRETATSSVNIGAQAGSFIIGDVSTSTNTPIFGYITNFRLVNGTAVYTSNFTPPTSPLTAIPNTQILIQGLVDRSPNAHTVTNNRGVTLSTSISPFV